MQIPKRRSEQFRKYKEGDGGVVYLTAPGLEKLKKNLARLEASLPQLIAEVERTKEYGDFSENAEYQEAKANLRRAHARIFSLRHQLEQARIISEGKNNSGAVEVGSTVVIESDQGEKTYQILGSHESDPAQGRISHKSPLGSILLGHKGGDKVVLKSPAGEKAYWIKEIK